MEAYVTNVFWSDGYGKGHIYVLYSDGTYDCVITQHNKSNTDINGYSFAQFANLRILRQKKANKEFARDYILQKDKEFRAR